MVNYLAHLYLSGRDKGLIVGNFIGDSVKGNQWKGFSEEISKGILMHRYIDDYTDRHPICMEIVRVLRPEFGRWSAVALDIFWDYFLASQWLHWSDKSLLGFADCTYSILEDESSILPPQSVRILKFMKSQNWLVNYAGFEGIDTAMRGLSSRIKHENKLYNGKEVLINNEEFLLQKFNMFFPQLIHACEKWVLKL